MKKTVSSALRKAVRKANVELSRRGLAHFTFGNASAIDRERGLVVIKPSGVAYEALTAEDMVVTDLKGKVLEGKLRASSDLATHIVLYEAFAEIGAVVHTHSPHATAWAQAWRELPCFGTTHADYFDGSVPVTPALDREEIENDYEVNTGKVIVRRFEGIDPLSRPAVLVGGHASFCWGRTVGEAVETASILEEVAMIGSLTVGINSAAQPIPEALRIKHFTRKHGPGAYYGQKKKR
ncbi:MAG TPA: L-ribulose-5-phosphate 4-epimerase AraD [Gemmatimonadaceae bacterium]|nr:L-ribulose-5-phosphate 4-epimerase AraD [Gemmatimonadaceae bacterium]